MDSQPTSNGSPFAFHVEIKDDKEKEFHENLSSRSILTIEKHAQTLNIQFLSLLETLNENLHNISSLSVDCIDVYDKVVTRTCDEMDTNIKMMYTMMAKCEELMKAMSTVPQLQEKLVNIKEMLSQFENFLLH